MENSFIGLKEVMWGHLFKHKNTDVWPVLGNASSSRTIEVMVLMLRSLWSREVGLLMSISSHVMDLQPSLSTC